MDELPKNAADARAAGWAVDCSGYPWIAYKGDRFAPTAIIHIPPDREIMTPSQILSTLKEIVSNWFPEEALKIDPVSRHSLLDPSYVDEIDLDQLAEELAGAFNVKVD